MEVSRVTALNGLTWNSAAISDVGTKIVACPSNNYLYLGIYLQDAVYNWEIIGPQDITRNWTGVVCNTDCSSIIACSKGQGVYKLTLNSTGTFDFNLIFSPGISWLCICSSLCLKEIVDAPSGDFFLLFSRWRDFQEEKSGAV